MLNPFLILVAYSTRMRAKSSSPKVGFTLIELSIVLVIIGLLAGGILIGRQMIRAAELRRDIKTVETLNVVVNTFRSKYNCLPGDCATATNFFAGSQNGDGDSVIAMPSVGGVRNYGESVYAGTELAYAVDQLARAELIDNVPFNASDFTQATTVGRGIIPLRTNTGKGLIMGSGYTDSSYTTFDGEFYAMGIHVYSNVLPNIIAPLNAYTPTDAFAIDSKMDDGLPLKGNVKSAADYSSDGLLFVSQAGPCASATAYNMATSNANNNVCALIVKAGF